jgi:uncharacterized protein YjbJ (UPF0337 family)
MDEKTENVKGRAKEAGGAATGNKDLKNEGKVDQGSASAKGKIGEIADKVKDVLGGGKK